MSGFKDIAKGGWHPKGKEGGKESWRGDFKGVNKVAGWVGKGKDPHTQEARDHQSAPLSTLRDPASFGPPPKRVAASPTSTTPDGSGLGSPISTENSSARQRVQERHEVKVREEEEASRPPPGPYRVDTTGLNMANLPKPPGRRMGQDATPSNVVDTGKPKPKLPPRLPPRQNSHPDAYAPAPPPPYSESAQNTAPMQGYINQGALNRLGNAGVSVPGLKIGRNASPPVPQRQGSSTSQAPVTPAGAHGPQLSELQSRFAKMSASPAENHAPSPGTSWTDKQAAMKTANALRNDPSQVSVSDMRNAASTANNFRERHGDQVAAGWQKANGLNQKYDIADRINNHASPNSPPPPPPPPQSPTHGSARLGKKPPPPLPPKRKTMPGNSADEPPPIPLSSKPRF